MVKAGFNECVTMKNLDLIHIIEGSLLLGHFIPFISADLPGEMILCV